MLNVFGKETKMATERLTFERTIEAPASQLYRAFTNSTALREWFSDAALADPRPGGRLYFWWNSGYYASGEFTDVKEEEEIAFTWRGRDEPAPTQVHVSLTSRNGATRVTVTHTGLGAGAAWDEAIQEFERGWEQGLENLESVLETGQDLRFVRRPMLGIMVGDFDAKVAKDLGVPATEGIRLDGAIEGMGAEAAGLQKDDVIVSIAEQDVLEWSSLTNALQSHYAGDEVEVVFYRGADKKSVTMELSGRPLPEVPSTPEALSGALRAVYEETDAELEEFLQGVTEEEATYHPEPDAWSVKETLAHLIVGERWYTNWITTLISDSEPWYDRYGGNVPQRNTALLAAYPTVPQLLEELKRTEVETVALLAALPPEFVARKGSYLQLGYSLLELPGYHTRDHLNQMREAVEAARAE
jgi:uncharacterized protein YndB with AHSA1/START domain